MKYTIIAVNNNNKNTKYWGYYNNFLWGDAAAVVMIEILKKLSTLR